MGSRVVRGCKEFYVHLLREVERYLRQNGTPPASFGRAALGDPRFVFDLRNGRHPRPQTVSRVRAYLEAVAQ